MKIKLYIHLRHATNSVLLANEDFSYAGTMTVIGTKEIEIELNQSCPGFEGIFLSPDEGMDIKCDSKDEADTVAFNLVKAGEKVYTVKRKGTWYVSKTIYN